MFRATDFMYDGVFSGEYGLKIASLDNGSIEETTYITPTITMKKPANAKKFYYMGTKYDEAPSYEFSVFSEVPISDLMQREILCWLDNRKGFKPLIIFQEGLDDYVYNCIFNVTKLIYHAGNCVGFGLKAIFDSPYCYGDSSSYRIAANAEGDEENTLIKELIIYNNCDDEDYVYPTLEFTVPNSNAFTSNAKEYLITIVNETDDATRVFKFQKPDIDELTIRVDNELKIITATKPDTSGVARNEPGDYLKLFEDMKWLRLCRGENVLKIKINGTATITVPQYTKIRF